MISVEGWVQIRRLQRAGRIGWGRSIAILKDRVRVLRPQRVDRASLAG
jgi:hypothetical protein